MPNIFDQFDTPTATVTPDGKNPFDAFGDNPFDQFDEPLPPKFANLFGALKLNPLQQVQMQSGMADPENAGATLSNLLRGNDDVFLQSVAPPITAAAHALLDNPVTRKIGYGLNFAGQAVKGDVESALFQILGFPELANQQLTATADNMNPAWKQKDESLGIDTSDPYEDARQTLPMAQRMASGIGPDLLQSVPQMVLAALQPELGAASFGFTPQGFDPVQAAAAMVAPGGGKMIGGTAEGLAAKAGLSNEQALDVINRVGGGAGVAGLISAPTAYQIAQMNPGRERDRTIQDTTSNAILTGILGGISGREEPFGKTDVEDPVQSRVLGSTALERLSSNGVDKPISQKIGDSAVAVKNLPNASHGKLSPQEQQTVNNPSDQADRIIRNVFPVDAQRNADTTLAPQPTLKATKQAKSNAIQTATNRTNLAQEQGAAGDIKALTANGAKTGKSANSNYRSTFFAVNPALKGQVVVHHAVEQQVLTRYPARFTKPEIHSIANFYGAYPKKSMQTFISAK